MSYVAPHKRLPSDPDYLYHATSAERTPDIAADGLQVHRPWEFTDQSCWPDGSTGYRAYFSAYADQVWCFAPEHGAAVILRVPRTAGTFKRESSTGDWYTTQPIPAAVIEILTDQGWVPLAPPRASRARPQGRNHRTGLTSHLASSGTSGPSAPSKPRPRGVPGARSAPRTIIAWHGSPVRIRRFSPRYGAQGVMWFTTNKQAIIDGESGAAGRNWIMQVQLTVKQTAGWDEYHRLMLGQLKSAGYDSVQLDDNWIIFDARNVKVIGAEPHGGRA
jgi:hypothetical protein